MAAGGDPVHYDSVTFFSAFYVLVFSFLNSSKVDKAAVTIRLKFALEFLLATIKPDH